MKKCNKCQCTYTGKSKKINGLTVCRRCWEMAAYEAAKRKKDDK